MESSTQENEITFLMAIGIIVMVALALAFILFFNLLQRKLLKEKNQRQELQLRHQETLLHSTILTQEKERSRIARDLHDEIGSKLNVIHLNMHRLKKIESQSTELAETVEEVNQLIHNTIDTTRRISHELLPPTLEEFGLIEALKELTDGYESSGQIEIILQHQSADWKRNKVIEINLFRIVQELLSNTVKHSDTESVLIDVNLSNQQFRLYYEDNGKGFLLDEAQRNGLGLRNLESRASMIKAKLDFQTAPEQGVKVTVANLS